MTNTGMLCWRCRKREVQALLGLCYTCWLILYMQELQWEAGGNPFPSDLFSCIRCGEIVSRQETIYAPDDLDICPECLESIDP